MTPQRKTDRRVAYTKLALREALVELMQGQHISGITVKSLCELADINRSTFYLHYRDQYDLLHQIEREVLETLGERLASKQDATDEMFSKGPISLEVMTEILEYARENAALARVLLSENCDFAFQQDIMELAQVVVILPDSSINQRMEDYIVTYGINGCIALAEKWLDEGTIEEPAQVAQLMLQLLYFGTTSFTKG
ncbi:MAG: TetR/AcrR family transcriptional regulator [Coriobacteriia bacterium]|nr:TetR/AcrR family transcriptional regulator [Coriobacteriia bacterium]